MGRKSKKIKKKMKIKEIIFEEYCFVSPIKYFYYYQKLVKKYGDKFEKDIVKIWGLK